MSHDNFQPPEDPGHDEWVREQQAEAHWEKQLTDAYAEGRADERKDMVQFETKTYGDGTTVTGPAPLPYLSPAEQELDDLLARCEALAGQAWLLNRCESTVELNGTAFNLKADLTTFRWRLDANRAMNAPRLRRELSAACAEGRKDERAEWAGVLESLKNCLHMLERADCSTGYCCCGSLVADHGICDAHSPVDMGDYHLSATIEAARAVIAKVTGVEP